jgi:hypothetical protein
MSYANFGPTYPEQSVSNLLVAPITVAAALPGDAVVETTLIRTAAGAELPLVLPEGTWVINAEAQIDPDNAARKYQYFQSVLYVGANLKAAGPAVFGADVVNGGGGVRIHLPVSYILVVPAGATRSVTYRFRSTGNTGVITFVAGDFSNIVATKISN